MGAEFNRDPEKVTQYGNYTSKFTTPNIDDK